MLRQLAPWTLLLCLCQLPLLAFAQQETAATGAGTPQPALDKPSNRQNKPLTVGIKVAPPFVMRDGEGKLTGISIDLWRLAAGRMAVSYNFVETDLGGLVAGLQDGSLDVAVAALTVTAERETLIDFTNPFYTTGLAIAVPMESGVIGAAIGQLLSREFLIAVSTLTGLLLLVGFLIWLAERKKNAVMFGGTPARGIGASFWWAAVTMTTVGYGDKAPTTLAGRLIALVWMFAAIIVISSFTAAIASSLTMGRLESSIHGPDDLYGVRVVTVSQSSSEEYLRRMGITNTGVADIVSALDLVAKSEYDALVYDKPILKYLLNQRPRDKTRLVPQHFERQDYALGIPQDSKLREPLNVAVLEVLETATWKEVLVGYLGK